jgi:hypothetical protein
MAQKLNFHTCRWGQKDGEIMYGYIHNDEVTSGVMYRVGPDGGRHYMTMDIDGKRKGWTSNVCPGVYQIKCGDDIEDDNPAYYVETVNGDMIFNCRNGRIKFIAENIDMIAQGSDNTSGNIYIQSNEKITIKSKNLNCNGTSVAKFFSAGIVEVVGDGILNFYGGLVDCADGATKLKPSKYASDFETQQSGVTGPGLLDGASSPNPAAGEAAAATEDLNFDEQLRNDGSESATSYSTGL